MTVKYNMAAIILAGGKSSRMGCDKNLIEFKGEPLLRRVARNLGALFNEVIIVTNQQIPFELRGATVVGDAVPYQGPLGGISAGLKASSHDINFVQAVDMPFASPEVIGYLAGLSGAADVAGIAETAGLVDVVVPRTTEGLEPLFAFYNKRCLSAIEEVLMRGERKVAAIFPLLNVKVVDSEELLGLPGADVTFTNINTEHDLERAEHEAPVPAVREGYDKYDKRRPPVERSITIFVDGEELVTLQCSLENLDELACGFLVAEGILTSREELKDLWVDMCFGEVNVELEKAKPLAIANTGKRYVTSGCGRGVSFTDPENAHALKKLELGFSVEPGRITGLMTEFLKRSHRPGMHSSALVKDDEVWILRQDIGRHNTVDMILGRLFLDDDADREVVLLTTGRISYELVVKAAKAGIPIIVSRTAATDMAVGLASELGIELVGYVRGQNMQVYTDGARIRGSVRN